MRNEKYEYNGNAFKKKSLVQWHKRKNPLP